MKIVNFRGMNKYRLLILIIFIIFFPTPIILLGAVGLGPPIHLFLWAILPCFSSEFSFLYYVLSFVLSMIEFLIILFIYYRLSGTLYKLIKKKNIILTLIVVIFLAWLVIMPFVFDIYMMFGVGGGGGNYNFIEFFSTQLFSLF